MAINLKWMVDMAHLSKCPSDLKQNGTQEKHYFLAQFSIPIHMVWSILLRVLAKKTNLIHSSESSLIHSQKLSFTHFL